MSFYRITDAKKGDKFYESEYGRTIYGEVITEPKTEGKYLSFEAKMSDGRTVIYGGDLENSAYWPTIVQVDEWPAQSKEQSKHEHKWQFLQTTYEYPVGYSGTEMAVEFAYFTCHGCLEAQKRVVKPAQSKSEKEK